MSERSEGLVISQEVFNSFLEHIMPLLEPLPDYMYVSTEIMLLLRRARRHGLRRYSTWGQRKLRRMSRKQRTAWLQHWNAWKP